MWVRLLQIPARFTPFNRSPPTEPDFLRVRKPAAPRAPQTTTVCASVEGKKSERECSYNELVPRGGQFLFFSPGPRVGRGKNFSPRLGQNIIGSGMGEVFSLLLLLSARFGGLRLRVRLFCPRPFLPAKLVFNNSPITTQWVRGGFLGASTFILGAGTHFVLAAPLEMLMHSFCALSTGLGANPGLRQLKEERMSATLKISLSLFKDPVEQVQRSRCSGSKIPLLRFKDPVEQVQRSR